MAGEIDDFDVSQGLSARKTASGWTLYSQYAIQGCQEAYEMAGGSETVKAEELGVIFQLRDRGLTTIEEQVIKA